MFELLGLTALVIIVVGVAAGKDDTSSDDSWACHDKFTDTMPQEVRDQALAVLRNGTDPVAMVKFAGVLRAGGYVDAADCVEARANELLSSTGGGAIGPGGIIEKPKAYPTAPVFAPKYGDPTKVALSGGSGIIPYAVPTGVPAAPPKAKGVAGD